MQRDTESLWGLETDLSVSFNTQVHQPAAAAALIYVFYMSPFISG